MTVELLPFHYLRIFGSILINRGWGGFRPAGCSILIASSQQQIAGIAMHTLFRRKTRLIQSRKS